MNKPETKEIYSRRVAAAVEYITTHLDEELLLSDIAAVAHFSPWHFHRIFKAFRGESLGNYISRLRVETAACMLAHSSLPVEEIAYNVGFGVPASLSKAFRNFYGTTPSEYRQTQKIHTNMKTTEKNPITLKAPKIVELEPKSVIHITLTGAYGTIDYGSAFGRLWGEVKSQGLFTAGIEHLCLYFDDPKVTENSELRTDICLSIHKPATATGDIQTKTIAGGRYAVFTHTGPYNDLGAVYDAIYGEWVPANCPCEDCQCGDDCKCILRDEPVFEKYCNDPVKTAPEKLRTEIYLPIK